MELMTTKQFLGFVAIMLLGMLGTYLIGLNTQCEPVDTIDSGKVMRAYRNGADDKQAEIELRALKISEKSTDLTNSQIEFILFGESQE